MADENSELNTDFPAVTENTQTDTTEINPVVAAGEAVGIDPKSAEVTPVSEPEGDRFVYDSTGNVGLDVALDFIGNLGIGGDDPAVRAAAAGDFAPLEAKLAAMGDKARGFEKMIQLGKDAVAKAGETAAAATEASIKAIFSVVGGADNWAAIRAHAAAEGTAEEKAELNKLMQSGPMGARAAATMMLQAYRQSKGTTINPRNPASKAAGEIAANTNGPLDGKAYAAAVRELHAVMGYRMEGSPEYAALQRRYRA